MRMNKKQAIQLTLALWDWLYENPMKYKMDWPMWKSNGGIYPKVRDYCFLCEYARYRRAESDRRSKFGNYYKNACHYCPLKKELDNCGDTSFYTKWVTVKSRTAKKKYSSKIANVSAKKLIELL